jgi:(E)-4-hydroxy-3-methylbut-2-enyl-diphosphate synthase
MFKRKQTRQVTVKNLPIGGKAPIVIQSMTNTLTTDTEATLAQIEKLTDAGCEIVRIAIPDQKSIKAFASIRQSTDIPLIADIHFQYLYAIAAIDAGADKVRINPGNIGSQKKVKAVIDAAKHAGIPVRIGVNSGSLEKDLLRKFGGPTPEALVESTTRYINMMEDFNFEDIVLSIKASDVLTTVRACMLLSRSCRYPLHLGITEAGTIRSGSIRSSVGIGILLAQGIGDTIRISLSGDPVEEIYVAKEILKSLELASGPVVIACPTCGRTQMEVTRIAEKVENMVSHITKPIKIAVMGCVVNGPGEAREADIGIAGGKGKGVLFKQGKEIAKVKEEDLLDTLWKHIQDIINTK